MQVGYRFKGGPLSKKYASLVNASAGTVSTQTQGIIDANVIASLVDIEDPSWLVNKHADDYDGLRATANRRAVKPTGSFGLGQFTRANYESPIYQSYDEGTTDQEKAKNQLNNIAKMLATNYRITGSLEGAIWTYNTGAGMGKNYKRINTYDPAYLPKFWKALEYAKNHEDEKIPSGNVVNPGATPKTPPTPKTNVPSQAQAQAKQKALDDKKANDIKKAIADKRQADIDLKTKKQPDPNKEPTTKKIPNAKNIVAKSGIGIIGLLTIGLLLRNGTVESSYLPYEEL
jgi:hypothetical protein